MVMRTGEYASSHNHTVVSFGYQTVCQDQETRSERMNVVLRGQQPSGLYMLF